MAFCTKTRISRAVSQRLQYRGRSDPMSHSPVILTIALLLSVTSGRFDSKYRSSHVLLT